MSILKPSYGPVVTIISTGLSTLAGTAAVPSNIENDNTSDLFVDLAIQCQFTAAAATTGSVIVYALTGLSTGVLSTTANVSNILRIGSVDLNGTTLVRSPPFEFNIDRRGPFWKLYFINSSNQALTAENVTYRGINYTDV